MSVSDAPVWSSASRVQGTPSRLSSFCSSSQPSRSAYTIRASAVAGLTASSAQRSGIQTEIAVFQRPALLPDDRPDACQFQRLQHLHGALPARHIGTVKRGGPFQPGLFAGDLRRHFTAGHLLIGRPQVRRRLRCLFRRSRTAAGTGLSLVRTFPMRTLFPSVIPEFPGWPSGSLRTTSSGVTAVSRQLAVPPDPRRGREARTPTAAARSASAPWAIREAMSAGQHIPAAALGQCRCHRWCSPERPPPVTP